MADDEHVHQIFIIKRHGSHEDAHHGGVWKIAFADFMTAMMAFFLVMWLISANDKTKATIASYFNPVKLVDTTTQPKGLEDSKAVESTAPSTKGAKPTNAKETPSKDNPKAEAQEAAKAGGEEASASKAKEKRLSAAVLDDPYAALSEIAGSRGSGETASPVAPSLTSKSAMNAISRKGGEAFRDPFSPPPPLQSPASPLDSADTDVQASSPREIGPGGSGLAGKGEAAAKSDVAPDPQGKGLPPAAVAPATGADIKAQIASALKAIGQDRSGPQVDVRKTDGGVLISLTDTSEFEMFSSGSALPSRKVVLMMDKIAGVLKAKPGKVIIRGFTDSRPYKAGRYDNWHLSLDRAQVTHYMLVRGGFDESRIGHIEGYADRSLRNPSAPTSPINRRIEILLKEDAP